LAREESKERLKSVKFAEKLEETKFFKDTPSPMSDDISFKKDSKPESRER
jgi:hypothetical protein